MANLNINGGDHEVEHIAFDGCHKIYFINTDESKKEAKEFGYTLYTPTANNLKQIWRDSCSLKFIQKWEGFNNVISQSFEGEVTIV